MFDSIYCCGRDHKAKVYNLPSKRGRWKRLYFLDECPFCGHTIANLVECNKEGVVKSLTRKTDKEALLLRSKLAKFICKGFKPRQGSFNNELILYNNKGIIFNFNNYKVGTNDDFIKANAI